jgi:hypothetical protein
LPLNRDQQRRVQPLVENANDQGATTFFSMQPTLMQHKQKSHDIYINREYYVCGCTYVVNVKSGEATFSFPCIKHKIMKIMGSVPQR